MDKLSILDQIDPEIMDRIVSRREAIARGASASSAVVAALALGSVPIMLGALAKDAFGQTPADVNDVLQFALTLEHLEAEFYTRGVAAAGLIPAADRTIFTTIRDHENAHVAALQATLSSRGQTPVARPTFDFTAGGTFPNPFTPANYATFQALAQAFEDTGVRAYKGQAGRLMSDKLILTVALTIHSVEARHAAEVRRLRGNFSEQAPQKGVITQANRGDLPAATQPIYAGEDNLQQGAVNLSSLPNLSTFGGADAATEAFDEPLTKDQVLAIVDPFIV